MKSSPFRPSLILSLAIALVLGLGLGSLAGAVRVRDVRAEVAKARAVTAAAEARAQTLRAERDRLRAERNLLEARLAAGKAPRVCPRAYVSTGSAGLDPSFSVDYPCAWHVLRNARPSDTTDPTRPGLRIEVTFFSRLPISLAPRSGPIADIELANWTDDPAADGDALPPRETWLADERKAFSTPPRETTFEGGEGLSIVRLEGAQQIAGSASGVVVLVWEFDDSIDGARHIVRAFAVEPSAKVRQALDRMARTFSVPRR